MNCSPQTGNYCNAWVYCTKADENYVQSENHPDFTCAPRTTAATKSKQAATKHTRNGELQKKRKKSFDALDLRHIVKKNCLKTKKGLLRFANKQLHEGKTDTARYILNNTPRAIKIMDACWEIKDAMKVEDRESKSRRQLLQYAQKGECVADCNGQWKLQTKQTLERNNSCFKDFLWQ